MSASMLEVFCLLLLLLVQQISYSTCFTTISQQTSSRAFVHHSYYSVKSTTTTNSERKNDHIKYPTCQLQLSSTKSPGKSSSSSADDINDDLSFDDFDFGDDDGDFDFSLEDNDEDFDDDGDEEEEGDYDISLEDDEDFDDDAEEENNEDEDYAEDDDNNKVDAEFDSLTDDEDLDFDISLLDEEDFDDGFEEDDEDDDYEEEGEDGDDLEDDEEESTNTNNKVQDSPAADEDLVLDFVSMVQETPVGQLDDEEITLLREVMTTIPKEVGGLEGAQMVQSLLYRLFGEWQGSGVANDGFEDDEERDYWEPTTEDFKRVFAAWEASNDTDTATHVLSLLEEQRDFYNNGLVSVRPDLETFHIIFRVLASSRERGIDRRAWSIYQSLADYDIFPDVEIYSSIIPITAKSRDKGAASRAENLLREAVERYPPKKAADGTLSGISTETCNVVVTAWAKSGFEHGPDRAEKIVALMDEVDSEHGNLGVCRPDTRSFTSVIDAYAQTNEWDGVRQSEMILNRLLDQYMNGMDHLEPNVATWTIVISAWARLSKKNHKDAADNAEKLLKRMENLHSTGRISFAPDVISYVTCMNALAFSKKADGPTRAEELLDEMNEKYLDGDDSMKPTSRTIKVVIDAFVKKGQMDRAEAVLDRYEESLEEDESPTGRKELRDTYRSMLLGYTNADSPINAQNYLEYMAEQDLSPDSICFNRIIDANTKLGDEGALERSQKLFELYNACQEKGEVDPDERVYTSFIRALTKARTTKLHSKAFLLLQKMRALYDAGNMGVRPTVFTLNAVLNACAECSTLESEAERMDALKVAVGVFNDIRKDPEGPIHVSFANMLRCAVLMPEGERRDALIKTTFGLCCERGFVNSFVIRDLQYAASEQFWRSLLRCPSGDVQMERLPASWSYRVEKRQERPERRQERPYRRQERPERRQERPERRQRSW